MKTLDLLNNLTSENISDIMTSLNTILENKKHLSDISFLDKILPVLKDLMFHTNDDIRILTSGILEKIKNENK